MKIAMIISTIKSLLSNAAMLLVVAPRIFRMLISLDLFSAVKSARPKSPMQEIKIVIAEDVLINLAVC